MSGSTPRGVHAVAAWAKALSETSPRSDAMVRCFDGPSHDAVLAAIVDHAAGPDAFAVAGIPMITLRDVLVAMPITPDTVQDGVPIGARSRDIVRGLIRAGHPPHVAVRDDDAMDIATKRCRDLIPDLLAAGYVPTGTHGALQIARTIRDGDAAGAVQIADAWIASGTMPARDAVSTIIGRVSDLTATNDARSDAALAAVLDRPSMPPPSPAAVADLLRFIGETTDFRAAGTRNETDRRAWLRRSDAAAVAIRRGGMPDRAAMVAVGSDDDRRAALRAAAHEPVAAMAGHLLFPHDLPHPGPPDAASVRWAMEQAVSRPDEPWTMALLAWAGTGPA